MKLGNFGLRMLSVSILSFLVVCSREREEERRDVPSGKQSWGIVSRSDLMVIRTRYSIVDIEVRSSGISGGVLVCDE